MGFNEILANGKIMTTAQVQSLLQRILVQGGDTRLGRGRYYFSDAVREAAPQSDRPGYLQIMEAVWSLVGQGLSHFGSRVKCGAALPC